MTDIENSVDLVGNEPPEEGGLADDCVGADKYIEIWKKGFLCDVFFEVGEEKRRFGAHRLILAFFSTVFHTCFFGSVPSTDGSTEENPTFVPDVNADAFELMLTFMYSGENIDSIQITDQVVVDLLYAAEKYHIPRLKHACAQRLATIIPSSAPWILPQALHYNDLHIAERCCDIICKDGDSFLASEGFLKCDLRALEMVVQRDDLVIESEISLLQKLLQWASLKCREGEMEETRSGKRAALGSLLYLVRFPLMSTDQLKEVAHLDILTEPEMGHLFTGMAISATSYNNFTNRKRVRPALQEDKIGYFKEKRHSILRRFSTFQGTQDTWSRETCFSVDRKINIIGIGVTPIVGDTAKIDAGDLWVYGDNDCDASRKFMWTSFQPQSVERRGNIVQFLSDQFPPTIPHKRYWIGVRFEDHAIKTCYWGPESARDGTQTVSVRGGSAEKEEIVTFTFFSADLVKTLVTWKIDNRYLAEIYFTL